jgi:hypothetical protein
MFFESDRGQAYRSRTGETCFRVSRTCRSMSPRSLFLLVPQSVVSASSAVKENRFRDSSRNCRRVNAPRRFIQSLKSLND